MKILWLRAFSLFFFLQVISSNIYAAQLSLQAPDIESPLISFDAGDSQIFDGIKTFKAKVTDNVGVAEVTLYYKGVNDVAFIPKQMTRLNKQSNIYTVKISVDSIISKKLEIYIKAADVSGNSVFEGQKFLPVTYDIVPRKETEVLAVGTEPADNEGMSTMTMVLIGLGAAILVGSAGGSSGGGEPASTGTITITTDVPN